MAGKNRELKVVVLGDASSAQRALGKLDKSVNTTGTNVGRAQSKLAKFGPAIATGAGLGVAAFVKVGGDAIEAASEGRQVAAATEAVIKSTGGVAGITSKHLADLSTSLKNHSTYEDEAIQHAGNLLLTFKEIRGEPIFDRATQAVVDMSTLMKGDLQGAAIMVGKALNDPITGLGSLTRIGVSFTPEQRTVIEKLVEIGDTAGAQAAILAIIEEQFKGQAQAARDARTPVEELRAKWGEVQEKIGEMILDQLPAFNAGLEEISKWPGNFRLGLDVISDWSPRKGSFLDLLAHPGDVIGGTEVNLKDTDASERANIERIFPGAIAKEQAAAAPVTVTMNNNFQGVPTEAALQAAGEQLGWKMALIGRRG